MNSKLLCFHLSACMVMFLHQAQCDRGAFRGRTPPNHCLCLPRRELFPPSEDCATKKLTGSVQLECSLRPETPIILVIVPKVESKNSYFVDFATRSFFCGFILEFLAICACSEMKISFFFLLVFTSDDFAIRAFLEMKTSIRKTLRICWNGERFFVFTPDFVEFRDEHLCFFGPRCQIQSSKVFVHYQIFLCLPPVTLL